MQFFKLTKKPTSQLPFSVQKRSLFFSSEFSPFISYMFVMSLLLNMNRRSYDDIQHPSEQKSVCPKQQRLVEAHKKVLESVKKRQADLRLKQIHEDALRRVQNRDV